MTALLMLLRMGLLLVILLGLVWLLAQAIPEWMLALLDAPVE